MTLSLGWISHVTAEAIVGILLYFSNKTVSHTLIPLHKKLYTIYRIVIHQKNLFR